MWVSGGLRTEVRLEVSAVLLATSVKEVAALVLMLFTMPLLAPVSATDVLILLPITMVMFMLLLLLLLLPLLLATTLVPSADTPAVAIWAKSLGVPPPPILATTPPALRPPFKSVMNLLGGCGLSVGMVGSMLDDGGGCGSSNGDGAELGVSIGTTFSCMGVLLLPCGIVEPATVVALPAGQNAGFGCDGGWFITGSTSNWSKSSTCGPRR